MLFFERLGLLRDPVRKGFVAEIFWLISIFAKIYAS